VKIYSSKMLQLNKLNVFVIAAEFMEGELKVPNDGFKLC